MELEKQLRLPRWHTTTKKMAKKLMLGASDTFRAAAIEQLKRWAEKLEMSQSYIQSKTMTLQLLPMILFQFSYQQKDLTMSL